LQQARLQMGQAPDDVDRLVRRLRRAELLRRSEGAEAPAAPPRSQPVAPVEAPATQPSASHPTPLLTPSGLHMLPTERTVVTEVSSADLRRMTQEEGAHPRVTRDPHEIPTRSVKAHSMAPPDVFESVDDSEDALRALLEQALDSSLSTRSDE
jgi:glucose/arabinose dehydrogenase